VWPGQYESPCAATGSPAAVSAASFQGPVSARSLATVFGDFRDASSADAVALPWPKELGGARVLVNDVAAPLVTVRAGQINFQVPQATVAGRAQARVTVAGREVAAGEADVATTSPGVFVLDVGSLEQPGAVLSQDSGVNSEGLRARRGEVVQIFATGAGAVSGRVEDGAAGPRELLAETLARPRVWFGVEEGVVVFSGLSPRFPGLWQVNVCAPEGAWVRRHMPTAV